MPCHPVGQKGRPDLTGKNHVTVGTALGGKAGMKMLRYRFGPQHHNILGKVRIGPENPGAFVTFRIGIEMDYLLGGMDSCVGPAGTNHSDLMISDLAQGSFDGTLYRPHGILLQLPAAEFTTIIFNSKRYTHICSGWKTDAPHRLRRCGA